MVSHDKQSFSVLKQRIAELEKERLVIQTTHRERQKFEELLTELSATFVRRMPVNEVDSQIEAVLQRIGVLLNVDRTEVIQVYEDTGDILVSHSWTAAGLPRLDSSFSTRETFPWIIEKIKNGVPLIFPEDLPVGETSDWNSFNALGLKSGLMIPYLVEGDLWGAVAFGSNRDKRVTRAEEYMQRLRILGEIIFHALLRKQTDLKLNTAFAKIEELKNRLQKENIFLRQEVKTIHQHDEIIGQSDAIHHVLQSLEQVAPTNSTVLISGETGTGKELVARAIHRLSPRKNRTMVTVNCAALPADLIESELFGREKGAFTGAVTTTIGRFETAHESTIFLDEIGEMPLELQPKLLRALQYGEFERLGSSQTVKVDVRVIAATNRNLKEAVEQNRIREDLYYRLNVFPLRVPPLKERSEDILPLTRSFIKEFNSEMGKRIETIHNSDIIALENYSWPGNVRELRNIIERAMIISKGSRLLVEFPDTPAPKRSEELTLEAQERDHIKKILTTTLWRIRGPKGAANILGINPSTLYSRMKKLGIQRPG